MPYVGQTGIYSYLIIIIVFCVSVTLRTDKKKK